MTTKTKARKLRNPSRKHPVTPPATFHSLARQLAESFVQDTRSDETLFWKVADNAPAWIADGLTRRVHDAIDSRGPDDWVYNQIHRIAYCFLDHTDIEDAEGMRDRASEIADGCVDIYNADMTKWLASNLANVALCDEAMEEDSFDRTRGVIGLIAAGQYRALETIAAELVNEIEAELGRRA